MHIVIALLTIAALGIETTHARPSFRAIRESAVENSSDSDAGWRMQFFNWEEYGLRTTYPQSWQDPDIGVGQGYIEARIRPHDNTLGQRKNYLLELTNLVWDIGTQLDAEQLEAYARQHTPSRFKEFYWGESTSTEVAGYPAWNVRFSTMTGKREETWVSAGRYVYTIGYRARNEEYFETDHFFYEDYLASVKITPVAEVLEDTEVPEGAEVSYNVIFTDIPDDHPYAEAITWAKETKVIGGYPDGTFQPDRTVNRAEFLKIVLSAGVNRDFTGPDTINFPDIDPNAWYTRFIVAGERFGIVQGYPDGSFKPEKAVNTAEALKMAYKALDVKTVASNGPWYQEFIDHAQINDILFERLDPSSDMKRKDVIWIVWRLSQ